MIKTFNVAKEFSRFPAGRSDNKHSGEELRKILIEKIDSAEINDDDQFVIELDDTIGYSSSFLSACFTGFFEELKFPSTRVIFQSKNNTLLYEINQYLNKPYSEHIENTKKYQQQVVGYHTKNIQKGVLGQISKIQEEVDEFKDAQEQGNKIMMLCELSDIYGALESLAESNGVSLNDLKVMSDATKRAFKSGHRK